MPKMRIKFRPNPALERQVEDLGGRLSDLTPALKVAAVDIQRSVHEDRFDKEQSPEGKPWVPLAPATRRRKKGKYILREAGYKGGLLGSITTRARKTEIVMGSNKVYARIHQLGGKAGRGHSVTIPARPYLGFSKGDIKHVGDLLLRHVRGEPL